MRIASGFFLAVTMLFFSSSCGQIRVISDADMTGAMDQEAGSEGSESSSDADSRPMDSRTIDSPVGDGNCTPTGAESCFNGIDDDCNGHIDCDDPACTGGTAPVAECVQL